MKLPFGKHKDIPIEQVPQSYLEWMEGQDLIEQWIKKMVQDELKRRSELQTKSSVGNVVTDSEDVAIQSLYGAIKRMPASLIGIELTLNKEYKVKIIKL